MNGLEWLDHDNRHEFANAVSRDVGAIVENAVGIRNAALIALPGGTTPRPIFARLATFDLPWNKTTIIPTDDRLVGNSDELSNFKLIAEKFLPAGAMVYAMATPNLDYKPAGDAANARLLELAWPPDLVWLGVGEDGHTASIFDGPDLEDALNAPEGRRVIGVMPDPLPAEAPVPRVTLTRAAIIAARTILIALTGEKKKVLLQNAITGGVASKSPIGRVLAGARQTIHVHWCRE